MTEYELVDAMTSIGSNLVQGQALTISLISAYMIVAYSVGAHLTRFQAAFISILLVLFAFVGFQGQNYMLGESLRYAAQLNEMRGGTPRGELVGPLATATVLGLRLFIFGGALTFMWRVRHPKTE